MNGVGRARHNRSMRTFELGDLIAERRLAFDADAVFPDEAPAGRERPGGVPRQFFINIDLDIELAVDPAPLARAFEPLAYSLERPEGCASFELELPATNPELLILEFVRLIRNLPRTRVQQKLAPRLRLPRTA